MARAIHKTFIAAVSAIAIGITALGASRAQAGEYDTERALAALLGLAVVGAIIAKKSNDDRQENQAHVVTRDRSHHGIEPRPLPRRAQRDVLPEECLRVVQTDRGHSSRVFGGRCLRETYAYADSLPRHCAQHLRRTRGAGHATVWNAHCLQRDGYRISRY